MATAATMPIVSGPTEKLSLTSTLLMHSPRRATKQNGSPSIVRSPMLSARHMIDATQRLPVVGGFARALSGAIASTVHPIEAARNDRPVPRTWFNRPVGAHRRVARVTIPVEDLKSIRQLLKFPQRSTNLVVRNMAFEIEEEQVPNFW